MTRPGDVVELNGERLRGRGLGRRLRRSDELRILETPAGLDPATQGIIASIIVSLVLSAVSIGISLLLRKKVRRPRRGDGLGDLEQARFSGVQTSVGAGVPVPVIFGEYRAGGQIIETFQQPQYSFEDKTDAPSAVVFSDPPFGASAAGVAVGAETLNTRVAWSWGPIESATDFEIDGNPVENLRGMSHETMFGTNVQGVPFGFSELKLSRDISSLVSVAGGSITETTSQPVDIIEVQLTFPQGLLEIGSQGDLINRRVELKIERKFTTDVSWTEVGVFRPQARNQSPFDVWFRFALPAREIEDVRVTRVTADNASSTIQDEFVWKSMVETRRGERAHPGIAQTAFRQIPQQQTAAPRNYTAIIKGLNDIRRYTTTTAYTLGWTANPAWCFLRWLTDRDFGLGRYYTYEDSVDLAAFISWAEFCDDLVSDGLGGTEARCRFDFEMSSQLKVTDIMSIFAKSGDADIIEQGGVWTVVPNRDTPVKKLISEGNYMRSSMKVSLLSAEEACPALAGSFVNRERGYKEDSIVAIDSEGDPAGTSCIPESLTFFGVTRPSQVKRSLGKMVKFSRIADEIIEVDVGLSALDLAVGDVVKLSTSTALHGLTSGRVEAVEGQTTLVLDQDVTLESGTIYEITVQHDSAIDTLSVASPAVTETTNRVTVSGSWSERMVPARTYALGTLSSSTALFRVMSKKVKRDYTSQLELHKYQEGMFDVELTMDDTSGEERIPDPRLAPTPPTNLTTSVHEYLKYVSHAADELTAYAVTFHWAPPVDSPAPIGGYRLFYRQKPTVSDPEIDIAPFIDLAFVTGTHYTTYFQDWTGLPTGVHECKVVAVSTQGLSSTATNTVEFVIPA